MVSNQRDCRDCKKFLSVSSNKESLTDFLCDYIKKHGTACLPELPECGIILARGLKDGTKVLSSTSSGAQELTDAHKKRLTQG